MMIKKPCLLCKGSGDVVDAVTKQFRPCALCKGKGFVLLDPPVKKKKRRKHTAAETADKVLAAIREYQKEYLDTWDIMTLKPMRLKDIGRIVKVDQATVYKCIIGQRIDSIDVRGLFSTSVSGVSNKAIMHVLEEIVKSDPSYKDIQLMNILSEKGINISRRTVAKYRQLLKIPSAKYRS